MKRFAAAFAALLLLAAPASAGRAKTYKVMASGSAPVYFWDPDSLDIAVGDKIVWSNPTDAEHHITPLDGPWTAEHLHVDIGDKADYRFKKAGTYTYYCDLHSQLVSGVCVGQCGSVRVE